MPLDCKFAKTDFTVRINLRMNDFDNKKTYGLFDTVINRQLISDLEAGKSKIYKLPQIETKKTNLSAESLAQIKNITFFDCLIFTDVLTVKYFLQILDENEIDLFNLDEVRILTFGETVSDELRLSQIHADIVPSFLDSASIINAMKDYFGTEDFQKLNILVAHEKNDEPEILNLLTADNLQITQMPVYQTFSSKSELIKLKIILESGGIDEFIITSPIDLISLEHYFEIRKSDENFQETKIIAKGELISKMLTENNIKHQIWFGQR